MTAKFRFLGKFDARIDESVVGFLDLEPTLPLTKRSGQCVQSLAGHPLSSDELFQFLAASSESRLNCSISSFYLEIRSLIFEVQALL